MINEVQNIVFEADLAPVSSDSTFILITLFDNPPK